MAVPIGNSMEIEQWLGADNKLGIDIWNKKYCYNGETFEQWLDRVSEGDKAVRKLIEEQKFLFGGRILANRGLQKTGLKVTFSNCYVVQPPEDSIESIFECASKAARTFSYGGGVGIDLSKLAPRGARINNTASETSGAVSFTDLYSMVTGLIGQHGRRGALMLTLSCEHPDLEEFMAVKTDVDRVTKANMSIRVTDKFMECVRDHETFVQTFVRPETNDTVTKNLDAYAFFKKLCYANWDYGEPGCLYWDRISKWNLLSEFPDYEYAGTNPCAEEPLPAGGGCLRPVHLRLADRMQGGPAAPWRSDGPSSTCTRRCRGRSRGRPSSPQPPILHPRRRSSTRVPSAATSSPSRAAATSASPADGPSASET